MLEVTFFLLPNGKEQKEEITHVYEEDASFFNEKDIKISMEQLRTDDFVIYADTGHKLDDETPDEIIYIVPKGQNCEGALKELRKLCEKRLNVPIS